ncbi:conserved hypothetical protein [Vibrio chagasii]|nr:conserved hypothetical protein [Vibrio chagasii]CAH6867859.1 conserved hypothetical protein [Vibrio chagasii]CAH7052044.1 conserved hypothetical protein [Vibrio chagasii]CAH7113101.1 conserved hypothetical protein [Vibrio chagasii]CAH7303321.1 conserved hypothetical protein [Vibrio chagasii]
MRILCAEDKSYYTNILDHQFITEHDIDYNGASFSSDFDCIKRYDVVISIQYLWDMCNLLIVNAKCNGVKTVLLTDGIVEWNNCFHHPAVIKHNNPLFSEIIHDVVLTPSNDVTRLINNTFSNLGYTPKKVRYNVLEEKTVDGNFDVLITTANSAYFNEVEFINLSKIIVAIIESAHFYEKKVALRIYDKRLLHELSSFNLPNIIECSFNEFIELSDVVISTPSSVVLTSMVAKKKTCQMIYRDSPLLLQSGWMIHHSTNIKDTIASLLHPTQEQAKEQGARLRYQESVVQDHSNVNLVLSLENVDRNGLFVNRRENHEVDVLLKLLNSPFNFNIEFRMRKLVRWIKGLK